MAMASASPAEIATLESTNSTGQNCSLRTDSAGRATLAYFRVTNNALKLWHDADGDFSLDAGELNVIDGNDASIPGGQNAGQYASLAFDPAGRTCVSYYHNFTKTLRWWIDLNANHARDTGEIFAIDTTGDTGLHTSLAFDTAGLATIAYYNQTNRDLKMWHDLNGNRAFDSGEIVTVESAGDVGQFASVAFDAAGRAMIAYYRADTGDLKLWRVPAATSSANRAKSASSARSATSAVSHHCFSTRRASRPSWHTATPRTRR